MPTKPPVSVNSDYRPKRPPKRKQSVAIPMRIRHSEATEETPWRTCSADRRQFSEPERPRLVTPSRKTSTRFGPVQDIDAEEHQRRGDAAVALFREIVRRAAGNGGT